MPLIPGTRLGSYDVTAHIGAGGMGEVYRARDRKLDRDVALKILPEAFATDPDRLLRFEREARVLAALNHPRIAQIFGLEQGAAFNAIVMELVDGETLTTRLARGRLPLDQVLRYGAQIADALAAAHAKGIVHRDLKPGNIMLTKTGAKVLDFGLAKSETDQSVTRTTAVLGTPAYMAPEQRQGCEADARTDIYSLGLVLREMATGKQGQGLEVCPPHFVHIVKQCLEPDPADRWQAASDVKKELEWAAVAPTTAPDAGHSYAGRLAWTVAAIAMAGMLSVGVLYIRNESAPPIGPTRFTLTLDDEIQGYDLSTLPVPSPTGESLVFAGAGPNGGTSLWVRSLGSVETRRLPDTEGAARIAWSPDGNWIAFYAEGKLKKVSPHGGPSHTIAEVPGFQEAAWGPGGDIIFRPTNRAPLFRIPESGGPLQPLTTLNAALTENSHRFPEFLPGGRLFFFVSRCAERANNALYIGSLDSPEVTRVMPAQSRVSYVPAVAGRPAMLVYYRDGALIAQGFDFDERKLVGDPTPLFDDVGYNAPSIEARFRVSTDGRVIVVQDGDPDDSRFVWADRSGKELGILGVPAPHSQAQISPAGDRVAFSGSDPQTGNREVWYIEIDRGITARLTTHVANDWTPIWSPDGRQLLFGSDRDGGPEVRPYVKTSMDPGLGESPLFREPATARDWSADGQWVSLERRGDLFVGRASGKVEPFAFLATPAFESSPRFSPDGHWIVYSSNESGRPEVYVRPFAGGPAKPAGKLQVSPNGGEYGTWGPGGRELFYLSADRWILSVDTRNLGRTETLPMAVPLFPICPTIESTLGPPFHTRDGQRFLLTCRTAPAGTFTVLVNWKLP